MVCQTRRCWAIRDRQSNPHSSTRLQISAFSMVVTSSVPNHRYAYALNNPASFIDPLGLYCPIHVQGCKQGVGGSEDGSLSGLTYSGTYSYAYPGSITAGMQDGVWTFNVPMTGVNWSIGLGAWLGSGGEVASTPSTGRAGAPNNGFTKYHCDLTGNCYKGPAINAKQIQCAQQALAKNGVALALDVAGVGAGFLPGGDLVVEGAQIGVGAASTVNSAIGGDLGGSLTSIFGIQLSALAPAAKWAGVGARAVPALGAIFSAAGALNDAYQTYQSYQSCLAGHS